MIRANVNLSRKCKKRKMKNKKDYQLLRIDLFQSEKTVLEDMARLNNLTMTSYLINVLIPYAMKKDRFHVGGTFIKNENILDAEKVKCSYKIDRSVYEEFNKFCTENRITMKTVISICLSEKADNFYSDQPKEKDRGNRYLRRIASK